jgi:mRNA-degrading endonuclease toxin of MazEF toxin-antitoxin module
MKPFEVFYCQPPGWPEPHPCVVISHAARAANKDPVEVLMCSSKRATRGAQAHEVVLDAADGMDWPTLCKCDLIYIVPKSELKHFRGSVSSARRSILIRTVIAAHGWTEILAA